MVSRNKKNNNKTISNKKAISNHLSHNTNYSINDIVNVLLDLKNDENITKLSYKKVTWSIYTLIYPI